MYKLLFFIFIVALNDGYAQEKNVIIDFSSGIGFVDWQSCLTKNYFQIGEKKSTTKYYYGYNLPLKLSLLLKNNKLSYGFGFNYEQLYMRNIEYDNKTTRKAYTKIYLQGEYQLKNYGKWVCGINVQIGKYFPEDVSLGNYEFFIGTGLIIQYSMSDKYILYFKPEYELKYCNVHFTAQEALPSGNYVKINTNNFIHHVNANIGFRFRI